ncbi:MAG TPA: metallophosphoesterase family protein [Acidobacteriota bacterium]|nr:metallophosphoesterase family protein [Acidobacteriota bacterium]
MDGLIRVGVISDTHGLLRPSALGALRGVDHIVHAGDIGSQEVLSALQKLAKVTAIRGNTDTGAWACGLPKTETIELGGVHLYIIHNAYDLDLDTGAAGIAAVISGHSHQPAIEVKEGMLFFNPGSAGPRRFHLPIALGFLSIQRESVSGTIKLLEP